MGYIREINSDSSPFSRFEVARKRNKPFCASGFSNNLFKDRTGISCPVNRDQLLNISEFGPNRFGPAGVSFLNKPTVRGGAYRPILTADEGARCDACLTLACPMVRSTWSPTLIAPSISDRRRNMIRRIYLSASRRAWESGRSSLQPFLAETEDLARCKSIT